ncbi:MAG: hypothetical protein FRX48_03819 [Lasallia pustulata]|uniref:Uncharacterized protein n=1 Tax=Lasallia pustulata TaxID=136370 RepID=A0A5M8PTB6_9LECA|nr:MAG: hypothetical protein FRX48_03819 [Lasallia pustulata]
MTSRRLNLALTCLFLAISSVHTLERPMEHAQPDIFAGDVLAIYATNASALAPYYRSVSNGSVWVIPSSAYDLGARGMSCECFDPDQTCCMAASNSIAPFCIAHNSNCCGDTYCNPGETCCGNACCPSNTTCTTNPIAPGCCPVSQTCSGPASCLDAASSNCSNASPPAQCCPSSVPYCRTFAPYGLGCFASSTMSSESAILSYGPTPTTTITFTYTIWSLPSGLYSFDFTPPTTSNDPLAVTTNQIIDEPYAPTPTSSPAPTTTPSPATLNTTTSTPTPTTTSTLPPPSPPPPPPPPPLLQPRPRNPPPLPLHFHFHFHPQPPTTPDNYNPPGASTLVAHSQSSTLRPRWLFAFLATLWRPIVPSFEFMATLALFVTLSLGMVSVFLVLWRCGRVVWIVGGWLWHAVSGKGSNDISAGTKGSF